MERGRERGRGVSQRTEKGRFIEISTMLGEQQETYGGSIIYIQKMTRNKEG